MVLIKPLFLGLWTNFSGLQANKSIVLSQMNDENLPFFLRKRSKSVSDLRFSVMSELQNTTGNFSYVTSGVKVELKCMVWAGRPKGVGTGQVRGIALPRPDI